MTNSYIVLFSSFKSPNDLHRHQQTHNPMYSYYCQEEGCNYAAKTSQSLRRHNKIWHEVKCFFLQLVVPRSKISIAVL